MAYGRFVTVASLYSFPFANNTTFLLKEIMTLLFYTQPVLNTIAKVWAEVKQIRSFSLW